MDQKFEDEKRANIQRLGADKRLQDRGVEMMRDTGPYQYTYNFTWMGLPIIQFPQDIVAMQEILWTVKPDLVIETGIARGGSLIFYASMFELLGGNGHVLGVDIDIRAHNRQAIESHPMAKRVTMIQGSSIDDSVAEQVRRFAAPYRRPLVVLDSNHTHDHVLRELQLYAPLVRAGSYVVVFDTSIDDQPVSFPADRPWGKGNNPKTALREFLVTNDRFVIDSAVDAKLLLTVARDGYLRCVRDA
jgi:cephalosporin hydroxylase